jgi:hypothetical protein
MKTLLLAAAGASMLMTAGLLTPGTSFAQGLPPGSVPPVYGSEWTVGVSKAENLNASDTGLDHATAGRTATPGSAARGATQSSTNTNGWRG